MKNLICRNTEIVVLCLLLFSACNPVFYASNAHNVPLLKEKHEVRIGGGATMTEDLIGPDVQVAYAAGRNLGIIANGAYLKGGSESTSWEGHGYIAEAGAGYFKPLGRFLVAEVYGGGGFSRVTNKRYDEGFSVNFFKPFILPVLGFRSNYFEFGFSPKVALVRYSEPFILDANWVTDPNGNYLIDQNGYPVLNIRKQKQTFFAFEPALTLRAGFRSAKVQLQAVYSAQNIPGAQYLSLNLGLSCLLPGPTKK